MARDDVNPRAIGRYEVLGRLATGGMAEVLLARLVGPSGFERPVVIKRILPHLADSREFRDMFLDEARLVARIRHPNVVQVHELGETGGELYLVMEYLEGENLAGLARRAIVRGAPIPYGASAFIMAEACAALHAAHELTSSDGHRLGLVHRDISPQNVFVLYDGSVRVIDFGIAKAADRSARTSAGQLKGKFQYMSPEQCLGKPLDRRSDVFSLGIVLFELSTGKRLFKRDNELLTFKAICEQQIVRPRTLVDGYPKRLEEVALKALARYPRDRFQTAGEMRRELLALSRELGVGDEPREAVSRLMHQLFDDRIEAKRDLLRRVSAGSAPTLIPPVETDSNVQLPDATLISTSVERSSAKLPWTRRRPASVAKWSASVVFAGMVGLVGWLVARPPSPALLHKIRPSGPIYAVAQRRPEPAPTVKIEIVTTPPGARVILGGIDRGLSPVAVHLPRSTQSVPLALTRAGFEPARRDVGASEAQRIEVTLIPVVKKPVPQPARTGAVDVPYFP